MSILLKGLWSKAWNLGRTQSKQQSFEEESLLQAIEQAQVKLERAWANLQCAAPEYVDVAILEIRQVEMEYSLLNRKYRMLYEGAAIQDQTNPRLKFNWVSKETVNQ